MTEEIKKPDEKKQEDTSAVDTGKGVQPETTNQFDRADKTVQELKAQNDRKEKLLEREEKLASQRLLSGNLEAGTEKKSEFTDEEKASRARIKAVADASGAAWGKHYE